MKQMVSSIAAAMMMLAAILLSGSVSASAASTPVPSLSISPSVGLTNNQEVTITGTGFAPNQPSLIALECAKGATSAADCGTIIDPITVSASGDFRSSFYVTTGPIGIGTCGTSTTDADCLISVGSQATDSVVAYSSIAFASGPGVEVTPSTNLKNGETASISGSNFTPGDKVFALECLTTATNEAGCATGTATPITVSSTGMLPATSFQVVAGTVGNGTCGTGVANYASCIIEVSTINGEDVGAATLDFVAPSPPQATRVDGFAIPGRTVDFTIVGSNFTGGPKVIGHAGTLVTVLSNTASRIVVKLREVAGAKAGSYRLIIQFASGKRTSVNYVVK